MENIHDDLDANVVVDLNAGVDANAVVDTNAGMDSRGSQRINGANHRSRSSRPRQQFIGAAAARRRRFGLVQQNFGLNHFSEIAELSATGTWNNDAGNRINHH